MKSLETIEKPAGQTLKDFNRMMEEIKPYLPPPTRIIEPKPQPYKIERDDIRKLRYNQSNLIHNLN